MIVVIDLIIGSFTERGGEVTVEIKILHLVAQVPEVKVSLQLLDFIWKPDRNLATASVVSYAIARSFPSEADAWLPIITY